MRSWVWRCCLEPQPSYFEMGGRHRTLPGSSQASSGENKSLFQRRWKVGNSYGCTLTSTCMSLYMHTHTDIHKRMHVHIHHRIRHHAHTYHTSPGHTLIICVCVCVRVELFGGCNLLPPFPPCFPEAQSRESKSGHLSTGLPRNLLQQVLFLVEVLEEGRLADELVLLAHLLAGLPGLSQLHLQGA